MISQPLQRAGKRAALVLRAPDARTWCLSLRNALVYGIALAAQLASRRLAQPVCSSHDTRFEVCILHVWSLSWADFW